MSESYRSDNEDTEGEDVERRFDSTETASEMLSRAREEKGLSRKEVADQLFLTEAFVRYIDDGEFHKIPKQPFVKGYLRSYARVVNLSGDDVVACYQKWLEETADTGEPRDLVEESPGINNFTGPVLQTGLAGLAGLVVIVAVVWWLVSDDKREAPEPRVGSAVESSTGVKESSTGVKESSTGVKESPAEVKEPGADTDSLAVDSSDLEVIGLDSIEGGDVSREDTPASELVSGSVGDDAQSGDVRIQRVTEEGTTYITVDAGGEDHLELLFSDDCWVEVQDAQGTSLYADLNHEGEVLTVSGVSPFEVLLGRASSVRLSFNNEGIDLGKYVTADDTARVSLGE